MTAYNPANEWNIIWLTAPLKLELLKAFFPPPLPSASLSLPLPLPLFLSPSLYPSPCLSLSLPPMASVRQSLLLCVPNTGSFSCFCDSRSDESNLRKVGPGRKGFVWGTDGAYSPSWQGDGAAGALRHLRPGSRERWLLILSLLSPPSPFYAVRDPRPPGGRHTHSEWLFPPQLKLFGSKFGQDELDQICSEALLQPPLN